MNLPDTKNALLNKTLANLFENTYNTFGAGLQPGSYFTRNFISRIFYIH